MIALLSAVVALGCALAAGRRLVWAAAPTSVDPARLLDVLRKDHGRWTALEDRLGTDQDLEWERDLVAAWRQEGRARDATVDEQLLELRWRILRWDRVPRVCASIATSAGFLFATIVFLQALAAPVQRGVPVSWSVLFAALTPFALGLAGTAFCVAVHLRARRIVPQRLAAYGRLVQAVLEGKGVEGEPGGLP
jgi:hypothetical protein